MSEPTAGEILVFALDALRLALPLSIVDRVERAVAITTIPAAPTVIAGVINARGELIPVIALRQHLHLPAREPSLSDQLVIARGARRKYGLAVDTALGVERYSEADFSPAADLAVRSSLRGAVHVGDDIIFIHDLDRFLSLDEEHALSEALDAL